jgi:putative hydrolase of the HAD superfamily
MPPKALLLDLDDTLIDTREGTRLALRDFHGSHGHLMIGGLAEAEAAWERGIKLHFPRYVCGEISFQEQRRGRIREIFARPDMPEAEADRLFRAYLDYYAGHYLLFDDVAGFLEGLAGMPVAIVTNGSVDHQTLKLRATGLDRRVPVIVISEGVGLRKPQKEIFEYAARALGVAPADCLMVGDNYEVDCLGAQGAGMRAVWINRFGSDFLPDGKSGIGSISGLRFLAF